MTNSDVDTLKHYFPSISNHQLDQFFAFFNLIKFWNKKINLISPKDLDNLFVRHILHSLAVAKVVKFFPGQKITDVGSGGGFPGIPLSILFPESNFLLIDSIGKKINVINNIIETINLKNTSALKIRSNELKEKVDTITGRAVTAFPKFFNEVKHLVKSKRKFNSSGILYLKGGDFSQEVSMFRTVKIYDISEFFSDDYFQTKKLIFLNNF